MPAKKGNRNGESAWFKPLSENEAAIVIQAKVPVSVKVELRSLLRSGETESSFVREAVLSAIAKKKSQRDH